MSETISLCPKCTRILPDDGVCRACVGCDYWTARPEEIDDTWRLHSWPNGCVFYLKDSVDDPEETMIWMCNLNGNWRRTGPDH